MLTRFAARTPGQVGDGAARHATAAETLQRAQLKSIQATVDLYLPALSFLSDDFGKVDLGDEDGLAGVSDLWDDPSEPKLCRDK